MDHPHDPSSPSSSSTSHELRERPDTAAAASDADRVGFLDSTGEFSCPHCQMPIRLEAVRLKFEGHEAPERIDLDLRHPDQALEKVVDEVRRTLAIRALREANGVKVRAAQIAGMKYTTFYELVRRLGITADDLESD